MTSAPSTRIGVIGTGYLGRLHARILTEMPEVKMVGFVYCFRIARISERDGPL